MSNISLGRSVNAAALHAHLPPDMDLVTESRRIMFVLDKAVERAEFVGTIEELVKDDCALVNHVLDTDEQFLVMEAIRKYEFGPIPKASMELPGSAIEETVVVSRKTVESTPPSSDSSSSSSEVPSAFSEEGRESDAKRTQRIDTDLSRVILLLEEKPSIKELARDLRTKISPQMTYFIKCLREVRNGIELNIGETAAQVRAKENYLRECYAKNELAVREIERLQEELVSQKADTKVCIVAKNILINRHKNKMEKMEKSSVELMEKRVKESEKEMANEWKASQVLQDTLKEDAETALAKFETLLRDHLSSEKLLRVKRTKVENQLVAWLQKFDQDIGEKQAEEEEIQAQFDEEKKQLEEVQLRLDEQEEEYDELMQEKAEYEREVLEQKLYIFILNRSARRIQRAFRLFKARKAAKKKEKKKGKRGKKKSS